MERGVQRWAVDISEWQPSSQDFSFALCLLPIHNRSSITRFVLMEDRKRALVSRLLQYVIVHEVVGIPYEEIIIKRTLEGKPYLESGKFVQELPNFNFNTSHHGDYVSIASEPLCLVGLDIVSPVIPWKETVAEFIQNFSSYFSSLEWDNITTAGNSNDILVEFYRYWCLKEAFVKATGSGLTYGLDKVEFHHNGWTNISVKIDGKAMAEWRFWLSELGKGHLVSLARGHPRSATDSYKKTLKHTDFDDAEYHKGLHLPNVSYIAMCYIKATSCKTQVGIFLSAPKCREDQHKIPAKFHLGVKCWKTHLYAITDLMDVNAKRGKHMYHPNTTCSWSRSVYDLQFLIFLILVCDVLLLWLKTEPKQFLKNSNRTWVYTYLLMDPLVSPFFL